MGSPIRVRTPRLRHTVGLVASKHRARTSAELRRPEQPYTRAVSRLLGFIPALCLVAACGGGSPEPELKAEGDQPATPTEPVERACRVDEVQKLAGVLSDATPLQRRSRVAEGLKKACDVPPSYVAFLDATQRDTAVPSPRDSTTKMCGAGFWEQKPVRDSAWEGLDS